MEHLTMVILISEADGRDGPSFQNEEVSGLWYLYFIEENFISNSPNNGFEDKSKETPMTD